MQFHRQTCFKQIQSPWGLMTLAASPEGLNGAWFEGQKHHPDTSTWQAAPRNATLLKAEAPGVLGTEGIKWNFTKFLVGRDGKVHERYAPTTTPAQLESDVAKLLAA